MKSFVNSTGTQLTLIITITNADGDHVDPDDWPITNDPAIVLSSHPSAAKVVTKIDVGVYQVVWSSLSPALTHGQIVFVAIDGEIDSVAWTTWQESIQAVHLPATDTEMQKVPRATAAVAAGGFVMTITDGESATVTYSEPA